MARYPSFLNRMDGKTLNVNATNTLSHRQVNIGVDILQAHDATKEILEPGRLPVPDFSEIFHHVE